METSAKASPQRPFFREMLKPLVAGALEEWPLIGVSNSITTNTLSESLQASSQQVV